jgi:hypothetical protein
MESFCTPAIMVCPHPHIENNSIIAGLPALDNLLFCIYNLFDIFQNHFIFFLIGWKEA